MMEEVVYNFEITRDWLDSISDDMGLTNGQQHLLNHWAKGLPYVGKFIPEHIAKFLQLCKGYRPTSEEIKLIKMHGVDYFV